MKQNINIEDKQTQWKELIVSPLKLFIKYRD